VLDLEDRVRQDLGRPIVDVAIETLAFGLEALEDALRDLDHIVLLFLAGGIDPRSEQIRGTRFDVLHDELQLLEAAVRTLDRLVRIVGFATRALLGLLLVGATEAVDLLTQAADLSTKTGVAGAYQIRKPPQS